MVWNCWRIWNDLDPAGAKHVVWKAQLPSLVSFPKPSGRLSWLWRLIMLSVLLPFKRFGRDLSGWATNAQNKNVSSGGLKYVEVVSCCVFGMTNSKNKGSTNRTKRTKKTAVTPRRLVFVTCPSAIFRFATLHVLPSTTRLCSLHGLPRALFALQDANAREEEKARSASNDTAKHHLPAGCPTLLSKWVEITWNWDTYYYYSTILVYSK